MHPHKTIKNSHNFGWNGNMKTSQATASIFCLFTTKPEGKVLIMQGVQLKPYLIILAPPDFQTFLWTCMKQYREFGTVWLYEFLVLLRNFISINKRCKNEVITYIFVSSFFNFLKIQLCAGTNETDVFCTAMEAYSRPS